MNRIYLPGQRRLVRQSDTAPCTVTGCRKIATHRPASNYCHMHRMRFYRNGDPLMARTPSDRDLARHRGAIERTLRLHHSEAAVAWAITTVERELFGYVALQGFGYQLWAQERFSAMRDRGCTPMQLLARVIECYALRRDEGEYIFKRPKAFLAFLARKVLRLKHGKLLANSNAAQLAHFGGIIDGALSKFAHATLLRMDKDREQREQFDQAVEAMVT